MTDDRNDRDTARAVHEPASRAASIQQSFQERLDAFSHAVDHSTGVGGRPFGHLVKAVGTVLHAEVPGVVIGERCLVERRGRPRERWLLAEVAGFLQDVAILAPLGALDGLSNAARVEALGVDAAQIPFGAAVLGRIMGPLCQPLDGRPADYMARTVSQFARLGPDEPRPTAASERSRSDDAGRAHGKASVLTRQRVTGPVATGVRAIDGLLSLGWGQRIGLFAEAGGGKSTLLGTIARNLVLGSPPAGIAPQADVVVVAMIGERGREVREFIDDNLREAGLARAVVVVSTADDPAMLRVRAAHLATSIAGEFRRDGQHVLLLIDSLTRFARAVREVGVAAGEPAGRQGLPPSVFAEMPRLLEQAGNNEQGRMLGVYTVLVEGEVRDDAIAHEAQSLLDGHLMLSERIGYYPRIDVLRSKSRVRNSVLRASDREKHLDLALRAEKALGLWREYRDKFEMGLLRNEDAALLEAIAQARRLESAFLQQDLELEVESVAASTAKLEAALKPA